MKKLKLILTAFALLLGWNGAWAYSTTDLTNAGWESVTSLPTPLSDYYFVFVDNGGNLMLDYATGSAHQGTDKKTMYYRTNADPIATPTMIWTITNNTAVSGTYSIKNATEPTLYLQEELEKNAEAPWYCHTHDNGGGNGYDRDWCAYNIVYADSKWTIQTYRVRTLSQSYVGPWDANNFTNGAEVAGNKEGTSIGYFQIYAIKRSKATPLNFTTSKITNPSFENSTWNTGWTNVGMQSQDNTDFNKTGSKYAEAWQPNGTKSISQTISGLPAGQYCLSAHCKARGVTSAKIYAGSNVTPITIADSEADYYVYFTNDGSSTVSIGFQGVGTGAGASWLAVDNFQLEYCGTKVNEVASDMPSSGSMVTNGWYSLIIPTAGNYNVTSTSAATIYYTQDGTTSVDAGTSLTFTAGEQKSLSLSAGTLFIKSSVSQVVDVDTRFYLITTVNDQRKWLNKNGEGYTYAYDKGLPFKLESSNGNAVLKFSEGNYLNDVGSNWQTKAEGSHNNEWKLQSEEGGYKLLLGVNNACQLFVANTETGLIEITHSTKDGNVWQFIQPATALSYAITDAEAHTLGFEDGEYAPYSNIDALEALATAKAATTNDARISAYTSLTNATWTANASEVNAFRWNIAGYSSEGETKVPTGGFIGSDSGSRISHNPGTNGGLNGLDQHMALMVIQNTNATYGETVGYTMPLKASTVYAFTFKYAGWGECGTPTIQILDNNSAEVKTQALATPAKTGHDNRDAWISASVIFQTSSAGNYKVKFSTSGGRDAFGDLILLKAAPQPVTITDAGYATFSSEYALNLASLPSGLTAYYVAEDGVKSTYVSLTQATNAVPANTGLLFQGTPNTTYYVPVAASGSALSGNRLVATDGKSDVAAGNYVFAFVTEDPTTTAGFYYLESSTEIAAGKAYLNPGVLASKSLRIGGGDASEVVAPEVAETEEEEVLYNMAGIQVDKNFKGFVINQKGVKRFNR